MPNNMRQTAASLIRPPGAQESAAANLRSLDGLLSLMAKRKGGKGVVAKAMEALQELFLTALLPDRRLKALEQQPLKVCFLPRGFLRLLWRGEREALWPASALPADATTTSSNPRPLPPLKTNH